MYQLLVSPSFLVGMDQTNWPELLKSWTFKSNAWKQKDLTRSMLCFSGFTTHPSRPSAPFSSTLPTSSCPHSPKRTRARCEFILRAKAELWLSTMSHLNVITLFTPSGIWWTSCWTPRWGCWSSGWLWSWCPSLWSTNSGLCSCLENMVRGMPAPLIIPNGYMHPAALEGALNTPEADREESQHLQLQPSLKNIPSSVRGVFTVCQFLHSLCCC